MKKFHQRESGERGWFIGDFDKAVYKTTALEAAFQHNFKGERSEAHYHKIATEISLITSGMVKVNGEIFTAGQGCIFEPGDVCKCEYLEDTTTMVVKVPGPMNDKYYV